MITRFAFALSLLIGLCAASRAAAEEDVDTKGRAADAPTYLLRYKFKPDETIRWKVSHQALVRTTVSGTTQTAETLSDSIKLWKIQKIDDAKGEIQFVHSVESVDMRQSISGRQDVRYNSLTDVVVPPEFEEVSKAVGVPLSTLVIDDRGHIKSRHEERAQPNTNPGEITVPLPEENVAVSDTWSFPHEAHVRQQDGSVRSIKTRHQFTLKEVDDGIATIHIETIVLTPIHDPALEAQLIQHVSDGDVRFDIAAGRLVGQKIDVDKRVVGFQGETSSMHYMTRFTEDLMLAPPAAVAAGKPAAGKAAANKTTTSKGAPATGKTPTTASKTPAVKTAPKTAAKTPAGSPSASSKNAPAKSTQSKSTPAKNAPSVARGKSTPKTSSKPAPPKPNTKTGSKPAATQQKRG